MNLRMRRALGVFLAVIMVFTGMPTFFGSPSAHAEGETPTDASYFKFDSSTGTINGYVNKTGPVDLVIPSQIDGVEVKAIAKEAFKYDTSSWRTNIKKPLESLVLPDTINEIGEAAFYKNNLKTLQLPKALTVVQKETFAENSKLESVTHAEGSQLTEIGNNAFTNCAINSIDLPDGLTKLAEGALSNNKISTINLPASLTEIGAVALGINSIERITIPANMTTFNKTAKGRDGGGIFFRNMSNLETKDLRFTLVDDLSGKATNVNTRGIVNPVKANLKFIDASTNEEIMPSILAVGKNDQAIEEAGYDAKLIPGDGSYLTNYDNPYKGLTILYNRPDYFEPVANNYYTKGKSFSFNAPAKPGYIPTAKKITKTLNDEVTDITFRYNARNEKYSITKTGEGITFTPSDEQILAGTEVKVDVAVPTGKVLKEFKVNGQNVLTGTENKAFSYKFAIASDTSLEAVYVDKSPFIFDATTGTITGYETKTIPENLIIPDEIYGFTVKHIGKDAFKYSKYSGVVDNTIKTLTLPDTLESIGSGAFTNHDLEELTLPKNLEKVSDRSFFGNKKLKKVIFPEGSKVKILEEYCFSYAPIEEINLPEGLTRIDMSALDGNNLKTVTIPSTVTEIRAQAFINNTIEHLSLPAGIQKLGLNDKGKPGNGILYRSYKDASRETFRIATVSDPSGVATISNTHAIVNPVKVKFRFVNAETGEDAKEAVEAIGIERKKLEASGYSAKLVDGSGEYLHNYELDHNNYKLYTEYLEDILVGNYFFKGKQEKFNTPEIAGFVKQTGEIETQLKDGVNEVVFKYTPLPPVKLTVVGDGVTTTPKAGIIPHTSKVKVKILEPEDKRLEKFLINGVDKKSELSFNGVTYSTELVVAEDTELKAEYSGLKNTFEASFDKMSPVLGEELSPVVKYRGKEVDRSAYTINYPEDKVKLTDDGNLRPRQAGQIDFTFTLNDDPSKTQTLGIKVAPVQVSLRLEDEYANVLPPTDVVIDKLYVEKGVDYWDGLEFDFPTPTLAIIKMCKEQKFANPLDKEDLDLGSAGNWMVTIGKTKFQYTKTGSFMYDVNNDLVNQGAGVQRVFEGDKIRVYYVGDWKYGMPTASYFTEDEYEVTEGDSIEFTLMKYLSVPPEYNAVHSPYEGAGIEVNRVSPDTNGDVPNDMTDEEGKISYTFNTPGVYHVSAFAVEGKLIRPFAKVVVKDKPVNVSLEGEGLASSAQGQLEKGSKIQAKVIEPANKELKKFLVNGVDKKAEMETDGVAYTIKLTVNEDTILKAVYQDATYEKEFEASLDQDSLTLGQEAIPTVKYRGKEIDKSAYQVVESDQYAVTEEGKILPKKAGEVKVSFKLVDKPDLTAQVNVKVEAVAVKLSLVDQNAIVLPPTDVVIDKLYLEKDKDYWEDLSFNKPVPALAIAKLAKEKNIANVLDKNDFALGMKGNWIVKIGDKFSYTDKTGSFMYDVNNQPANLGIGSLPLNEGDHVKVYYTTDYTKNNLISYFTQEEYSIDQRDSVEFTLMKHWSQPPTYETKTAPMEGMKLEIKKIGSEGQAVVSKEATDSQGKISYKFVDDGTYQVSIVPSGNDPIIRPYAKVIVNEKPLPVTKNYERYTYRGVKQDVNPNPELAGDIVWTSKDAKIAEVKDGKIVAKSVGQTTITGKVKHYTYNYKVSVGPGPLENFTGYQTANIAKMKYKTGQGQDGVIIYRAIKKDGKFNFKYFKEEKIGNGDLQNIESPVGQRGQVTGFIIKPYKMFDGKKVIGPSSSKLYFADKIMLDGAQCANLNPFDKDSSMKSYNKKIATVDKYGLVIAKGPGKTTLTFAKGDEVMNYRLLVRPQAPSHYTGSRLVNAVKLTFKPAPGQDGVLVHRDGKALVYARGADANSASPSLPEAGVKYNFKLKAYKIIEGEKFFSPETREIWFRR